MPDHYSNRTTYYSEGSDAYTSPFVGCSKLASITVPEGMTTLPAYAFRKLTALKNVTLPGTLTAIGAYAFEGCSTMEAIWVAEEIASVGSKAFANCTKLTIHGVSGSYIEEYATANSIPFSTEPLDISDSAFSGKITDSTGAGIEGVSVCIWDVAKNEPLGTYFTAADGSWFCDEAISGRAYRIRYHHPAYSFAVNNFDREGSASGVTLPETKGTFRFSGTEETDGTDFTYSVLNGSFISITKYNGRAEEVVIPAKIGDYTVQAIGADAFNGNTSLKRVRFPDTVTSVGAKAFYGCTALTTVGFDDALTTIGSNCFEGCTALKEVDLPNSLTTIQSYAFNKCTGLTSVEIPDGVTSISARAFYNCTSLSSVKLPLGWKDVPDHYSNRTTYYSEGSDAYTSPFEGCSKLTSITVPEKITTLPAYAFRKLTALKSIELPDNMETIGIYAFAGCTGLTKITLPSALTTLSIHAFDGCTGLQEVELPAGITVVYDYAFAGCTGLTSVTLPTALTSIRSYAFSGCTGLTSIEIPDSVTSMTARAFYNCTNLSSVKLPVSWESVPDHYSNRTTYYSEGSDAYTSPFEGCSKLTSITVPEKITTLPAYAFRKLTALKSIELPDNMETIGIYAFAGCTGLTKITLPSALTTLSIHAFDGCTGLQEVELPAGITVVYDYAFAGCTGLTSVTLPTALTSIRSYAFSGCTGLTSIEIPDSVTSMTARAFYNCTNLSSVKLPVSWESVPDHYSNRTTYYSEGSDAYTSPFVGCSKLASITVPEGMTTLPAYAFRKLTALKNVTLPGTLTAIGAYAFEGCSKLKYIEPVDGLLSIGNYAFSNCTNLEKLYLPDTVTSYGTNVFKNCAKLTVECKEYSFATIYCIDAGIPVEFVSDSFERNPNLYLDRDSTYYVANTVGALTNGYITMNLAYGYKADAVEAISGQELSIRIPSDMTLLEKTLKLNGVLLTGYQYSNNLLTVPLTKTSGSLAFSLKPTGDSTVTTYAIMSFQKDSTAAREVIGIINERLRC